MGARDWRDSVDGHCATDDDGHRHGRRDDNGDDELHGHRNAHVVLDELPGEHVQQHQQRLWQCVWRDGLRRRLWQWLWQWLWRHGWLRRVWWWIQQLWRRIRRVWWVLALWWWVWRWHDGWRDERHDGSQRPHGLAHEFQSDGELHRPDHRHARHERRRAPLLHHELCQLFRADRRHVCGHRRHALAASAVPTGASSTRRSPADGRRRKESRPSRADIPVHAESRGHGRHVQVCAMARQSASPTTGAARGRARRHRAQPRVHFPSDRRPHATSATDRRVLHVQIDVLLMLICVCLCIYLSAADGRDECHFVAVLHGRRVVGVLQVFGECDRLDGRRRLGIARAQRSSHRRERADLVLQLESFLALAYGLAHGREEEHAELHQVDWVSSDDMMPMRSTQCEVVGRSSEGRATECRSRPYLEAPAIRRDAMGSAKKPWRYYYVLTFPLSTRMAKDKLASIVELTETMERREEEYVRRVVARNEQPRPRAPPSPLVAYIASCLRWLSGVLMALGLVLFMAIYVLHWSAMSEQIQPMAITVAYGVAVFVMVFNGLLFVCVSQQHTRVLYVLAFLLALTLTGIAFMLDQLKSIRVTQYALSDALRHSRRQFTPQLADLVLNGGDLPSLWHRFFADGPAWFLLWLEQRCSSTERSDDVDGNDFFTPFWKGNVKTCAETCLSTHLWLEGIVQGVLTTFFVVQSAQLVLLGLFLWSHDSDVDDSVQRNVAASKNRRPKRRRRQDRRAQQPTDASTWSIFSIVKISIFGLFLSGTTLVVVGGTLLNSCDFDDTTSWILMGVTAFGVIQLVVALLASLEWRTQLVQSFLLASLALESYVNGSLEALIADLAIGPLSSTGSSSSMVGLRDAYDSVFMQTCQPVKRWRLHVCVDMSTAPTPHGHKMLQLFDSPVCQTEFTSLLLATAQHSLTLISWMMLAQGIVLLWFLLPHIQARFKSALAVCCCVSDISVSPSVSMKSLAEQKAGDSSTSTSTSWRQPSLAFEEAQRLYLETLKCADTTRRLAEAAAFETEWMKMTGRKTTETSSGAVMFVTQFEAITRTLILRRLTERCKLDVSLSISAHGRWLVVKIFASDNLLMTTLCHESTYKLQVADAVDPGRAFWQDMREVKADNKVLDPHVIHQKFKLLLQRGAVAQKEAERVPSESLASVSARVHALMRIHRASTDALRCRNTYLPFVAYTPQTHLQYLYKKYPNQLDMEGVTRRSAVLRTIDCLRLTRRILDTEFDLDHMRHQNILVDFTSLHSASRLDVTSRDTLLSSWVAFWRPQYLPGEFEPETHWFLNQLGRLSPFRQPLRDVRDYFGECIAFYFAWLAFYNQLLLLPTVAVVILLAAHLLDMSPLSTLAAFYRSSHSAKTPFQPPAFVMRKSSMAFGLSIVLWGFIFAKLWSRRSVWYQLEWGMTDMELGMTDRANFRGETRRNPITQQLEIHFPGHKRLRRQVTSVLVILGVSVAHLILSTLLLLSQGVLAQWIGLRGGVTLSLVGLSLMIQWNGDHISMLSHYLSEWENYQNEPAFQQSVIFKVLALQIANTYAPLWIIAFGFWSFGDIGRSIPLLDSVTRAFRDRVESHTDAVIELQLVLWLIFLTRIASHMTAMIQGVLRESQRSEVSTERSVPSLHVETELALGIYRGSYEDYTEIVMQIGLIVMFSSIFPLAPVLAFVECALELRLDALDLCLFLRRPNPDVADGIGPWSTAVDVLLQLGLLVNLALLYFMASNYSSWSLVRRLGAYLGCVVLGWLVTQLLYAMVPSSSDSVREAQARNAFLIDRYFGSDRQSNYSDDAGGSDTKRDAVAAMTAEYEAAMNVEETSADTTHEVQPEHYRERLMLLHRLNVALRRQGETADLADLELSVQHDTDAEKEEHVEDQDESSEEEEQMIVGYIRRPLAPPEPVVEDVPKVTEPVPPAAESATTPLPSAPLSPPSPPPAPYHRATLSGMEAIQVASQRDRFDFAQGAEWRDSESPKVKSPPTRRRFSLFSRKKQASSESLEAAQASSAATTPVVQLSGLDAVHEATRRDHFDFSADPWREGGATL